MSEAGHILELLDRKIRHSFPAVALGLILLQNRLRIVEKLHELLLSGISFEPDLCYDFGGAAAVEPRQYSLSVQINEGVAAIFVAYHEDLLAP